MNRFSSRRQRLDHAYLARRLAGAKAYRRIAGYFRSSIFELVGEQIAGIGKVQRVPKPEYDGTFRCCSLGRRAGFIVRNLRDLARRAGCTAVSLRVADGVAGSGYVAPCWLGEGCHATTQRRDEAGVAGSIVTPKCWTTRRVRAAPRSRATGSPSFRRGPSTRVEGATGRPP